MASTPTAIVLGAGMVGSVMAVDLATGTGSTDALAVTIADSRPEALERARARAAAAGCSIDTIEADLADPAVLRNAIEPFDIVLGALASSIGFATLRTVIEAGKDYCDISFMPEDAIDLDALARKHDVTAIVDCGVAPGMSNLLAARGVAMLDRADSIEIYVGGLPRERRRPFEYKAGFSPADVIEEYTRPARIVEGGEIVVRPALSEPELMDFAGVGTLESFNTDGLRSLAYTMKVPDMKEKTLRYPGHIELMRVFRETGLFGHDEIEVGGTRDGAPGVRVKPIDVISKLMFPKWTYEPDEEDLTVMRIVVEGEPPAGHGRGAAAGGDGGRRVRHPGRRERHTWDLLDFYDKKTRATSMSRTTAIPCTIMARLVAAGSLRQPGVNPPELLGADEHLVEHVLAEHRARGIEYHHRVETIG
ncbi:MAG: saccharopine dehydrogenase C-terminal domain-containing protein [Planctomycetota bacterium]|nr:saccharopine dehydrogenase C-terminal domain-containing protein [Planctomycetota bacterium]